MKSALLAIVLVMMVAPPSASFSAGDALLDLVPREVSGWKPEGEDGLYNRDNLFDYINGGAEVYLAYAYRQAFARRFVKADQPAITADVFDMGTAEDAYGIFTFDREGKSIGIGQDSEYTTGFLRFWKGRYFVSILADRETPEAKETVLALGRDIASRIDDTGERPKMLDFLPPSGLVAASVRFFHEKSSLDYHYFLADKNILNLSKRTNVLLAKCKAPARQGANNIVEAQVLVVEYPIALSAFRAYRSFMEAYLLDSPPGSAVKTEDGKFALARQKGKYLVAVFEAPDALSARALVEGIIADIEARTGRSLRPSTSPSPTRSTDSESVFSTGSS